MRVCGRGRGGGSVSEESESSDEEENGLPEAACDISVTDNDFKEAPEFHPRRTPGPHLPPNINISALGLFQLYFDAAVITHAVESTNAYAEENKEKKPSMYKRFGYKQLNNGEMLQFITALLLLGITGVRSYNRKAWTTKRSQAVVRLNELMTQNRFEAMSSFFHMVTPEEERDCSKKSCTYMST